MLGILRDFEKRGRFLKSGGAYTHAHRALALGCPNCSGATLKHVECTVKVRQTRNSDQSRTIGVTGYHSNHKPLVMLKPPPSVIVYNMIESSLGNASDTKVKFPVMNDTRLVQQWNRSLVKEFKGENDLKQVAKFNELHNVEYVLGDVGVDNIHCSSPWQRQIVKEAMEELADESIADEKRKYDGIVFTDTTYCPCDEYYMHTSSIYNYELRQSIPILTTWMRHQSAANFTSHFRTMFHRLGVLYEKDDGEQKTLNFGLNGFVMDFSRGQMMGLEVAYGMEVMSLRGLRPTLDNRKAAQEIGQKWSPTAAKGL